MRAPALLLLALLAGCLEDPPEVVQVTENLQLVAMVESSARLLPEPSNDTEIRGSFNPAKVQRLSDPPGAPDDDTTRLEGVITFIDRWERDTFTVSPALNRAGVITEVVGFFRAYAASSVGRARGVATLDGVTVIGADIPLAAFTWDSVELDLPHPAGKTWTYDELERAVLGYEFRLRNFTSENKITQFYPIIKAETAAGAAGQGIQVNVGALAGALDQ